MRAGIAAIDGVRVLGDGTYHLVAMAGDDPATAGRPVDVFAVGDALRGARLVPRPPGPARQPPRHRQRGNVDVIDDYLADLAECVAAVRGHRTDDRSTTYATLE